MDKKLINDYSTLKGLAEDKRAEVCRHLVENLQDILQTASHLGIDFRDTFNPESAICDIYYDEEGEQIYFTTTKP